jgi:hypothetical protein
VSRGRSATLVARISNTVVFVGAAGPLYERVRHAAQRASGAVVTQSALLPLASLVTEIRPYAIVIPTELYEFCGDELDALARDVRAGVVVVSDTTQPAGLLASLVDAASRMG